METDSNTHVILECGDKRVFAVNIQLAKMSGTIKAMLEAGLAEDDSAIPLPDINGDILEKVLQWAAHHKDDDPYCAEHEAEQDPGEIFIPPWDAQFLLVSRDTLYKLIRAANYLELEGLMALTTKMVSLLVLGKSNEEIRETFDIEDDLSPEQEAQMGQDNTWCDDNYY